VRIRPEKVAHLMRREVAEILQQKLRDPRVSAMRHELGPRLGLREVPEVRFVHDDSLERGARVEDLLKRLHDGRPVEDEEPE